MPGRDFFLVPAGLHDLDGVMALEEGGFAPGIRESREVFARRIEVFPQGLCLLVEGCTNRTAGYISCEVWKPDFQLERFALGHDIRDYHDPAGTELYISSMTVDPVYRGLGLGSLMLSECLARQGVFFPQLAGATLIVHEDWKQAARIYRDQGFLEAWVLEGFFKGAVGGNAVVMRRLLP